MWKRREIAPKEQFIYIVLTSGVKFHIHLLNVVVQFIVSSFSQIWYVEVRISRSVSLSPLEFEITRVDCKCRRILEMQDSDTFWHVCPKKTQIIGYSKCPKWRTDRLIWIFDGRTCPKLRFLTLKLLLLLLFGFGWNFGVVKRSQMFWFFFAFSWQSSKRWSIIPPTPGQSVVFTLF